MAARLPKFKQGQIVRVYGNTGEERTDRRGTYARGNLARVVGITAEDEIIIKFKEWSVQPMIYSVHPMQCRAVRK